MIFRRGRFGDVIHRQLALFEREHADRLAACAAAERAYDEADREDAEERYGAYDELLEEAAEALAGLRDAFAGTLEPAAAAAYAAEFDREAARRLPRLAGELGER